MDEVSQSPGHGKTLICDKCGAGFPSKYRLEIHQRIHQGKKLLKCQYCRMYFLHKSHLKVHERSHTGKRMYKCDQCGEGFQTDGDLNFHKRHDCLQKQNPAQKKYSCDQCEAIFANSYRLRIHLQTHRQKKTFKCQYCDKCFLFKSHIKVHERTHTGEKPYKCNQCGQCFLVRGDLNLHKRVNCLNKSRNGQKYTCDQCGAEHANSHRLRIHLQIHRGKEIHKCRYCGKSCLFISELKKHESFHTREEPHECDQCGMKFVEKAPLILHKETYCIKRSKSQPSITSSNHTPKQDVVVNSKMPVGRVNELKFYKCEKCRDVVFNTLSGLQEHWKLHTEEGTNKPLTCTCDKCGKLFTTRGLEIHKQRSHNGEGPNVSNAILKKKPNKEKLLTYTIGKSTERKLCTCDQCGKVFAGQDGLQRHLKLHTRERPKISSPKSIPKEEPCEIEVTLTNGKDTNSTGKKTYKKAYGCDQCGKCYTTKWVLQRHQKSHNKETPNIYTPDFEFEDAKNDSDEDIKMTVQESEETFFCKDCGIVVKVRCTNLANVLSLTNSSNVKCFIEKHTLLPQ